MNTQTLCRCLVAIVCAAAFAGCGVASRGNGPPPRSTFELTGNTAERVDKVTKMLGAAAPSALSDANMIEVKIGDGELGPSDYIRFIALQVSPSDVEKWRAIAKPMLTKPDYVEPPSHPAWWVSQLDFDKLVFRDGSDLGLGDGWIGVAGDGRVFMSTQTR